MEAVDEYIPDPVRQLDKPFLMPIEDVFSIQVFRCSLALWFQELFFRTIFKNLTSLASF